MNFGTIGPSSCEGSCGGNAGNCYCDNLCDRRNDCCPDVDTYCSGMWTFLSHNSLYLVYLVIRNVIPNTYGQYSTTFLCKKSFLEI